MTRTLVVLCAGLFLVIPSACGGGSDDSEPVDGSDVSTEGGVEADAELEAESSAETVEEADGVGEVEPEADGGGEVVEDAVYPPGHTEDMSGVMHRPGKEDPLANCTSCHGADLTGGVGPSCYDCHDNSDHTSVRGGYSHRSGSSSSCETCHGPGNSGGLGPACSVCH
ncbi:MAG: hypothetical protein HY907_19700 [Deltaproteobacteria bacterium]|nr:hypothetical protein [Deltaproteobacteria bacterium]